MFEILARFTTVVEAELVKSLLAREGIHSDILDANLSYSLGPTLSQGIRLQVRKEDYEKALEIYTENQDFSDNDLQY